MSHSTCSTLYALMVKYFKQSEEYSRCVALNYFPSQIPAYKNSKAYKDGLYFIESVEKRGRKRHNLYCDLRFLSSDIFRSCLADMNELHIISNELNIHDKIFNFKRLPMIKSELDLSSITFSIDSIKINNSKFELLENLIDLNVSLVFNNGISCEKLELDLQYTNELYRLLNVLSRVHFVLAERIYLRIYLSDTYYNNVFVSSLYTPYIFLERFFSNIPVTSVVFIVNIFVTNRSIEYINPKLLSSGDSSVKFEFDTKDTTLWNKHKNHYFVYSDNGCWNIVKDVE